MVRAWVSGQLQKKHGLPRHLPLSYIGEKVLSKSDVSPKPARFLLPARARARLPAFLYPAEITACGFNRGESQLGPRGESQADDIPGRVLVRLHQQRLGSWPQV